MLLHGVKYTLYVVGYLIAGLVTATVMTLLYPRLAEDGMSVFVLATWPLWAFIGLVKVFINVFQFLVDWLVLVVR